MFSLGRIMSLCCGGGVRVMTRGGTSWCVMVWRVMGGDGDCTHIGYKGGQIMIHEPPGPSHFSSKRQI